MIWWMLNKLFGWDYIAWENSCDRGIARIHTDETGMVYYWRYRSTLCCDYVRQPSDVKLWLTCQPTKYLKECIIKE